MRERDELFKNAICKQFEFDEKVAAVFDDMLTRSIPYYQLSLELGCDLLARCLPPEGKVYDLGCSTATTLLTLWQRIGQGVELIGIDNSPAMIERARRKIEAYNAPIKLIEGDITKLSLDNANAIIANYTLQFIRPLERTPLVRKIYEGLTPGGLFLFSEKTICDDKKLMAVMIDHYHDYKKSQGYSELEIMKKREALENVLIPYTVWENRQMVLDAGFSSFEILFKYNNFATFVAIK